MSDVVVRIENLGKRYRYGGVAPLSDSLRADIADWVKGLFRPGRNGHRSFRQIHEQHLDTDPRYFWALKDINLEIRQGEVVGIIGRNGAGKSTLLKILSRITPPTTGRITYRGRIASLLEVGTGFHRELTGRENIYLNGSILGMTRREITRKLDEIVAFAEIEKFLDTPVKFYSSGMYVRLAFAVAAHLDPEILVVDEVLAVGDVAYQAKCIGKMRSQAQRGTTILFVTHNMQAVRDLCTRVVVLEKGRTVADGSPSVAIPRYLQYQGDLVEIPCAGSESVRLNHIRFNNKKITHQIITRSGDPAEFVIDLAISERIHNAYFNVHITLPDGQLLIHLRNDLVGPPFRLEPSQYEFIARMEQLPLNPGNYLVSFRLASLDPKTPVLWDLGPIPLHIEGSSPINAPIVVPYHMDCRCRQLEGCLANRTEP